VQRATTNPEGIEALKAQQLSTTWFGPEESNKSFLANAAKMAKYVDLLRAS
jgi:hypothetical protein